MVMGMMMVFGDGYHDGIRVGMTWTTDAESMTSHILVSKDEVGCLWCLWYLYSTFWNDMISHLSFTLPFGMISHLISSLSLIAIKPRIQVPRHRIIPKHQHQH